MHIHLQKRYISHVYYNESMDGMKISNNKKEDILSVCFITVVIVLMLIIQITGAI
jgi:hypothetical protein